MTTKELFPKYGDGQKRYLSFYSLRSLSISFCLKWINPPITMTQLVSWITGHGLKRDYVDRNCYFV